MKSGDNCCVCDKALHVEYAMVEEVECQVCNKRFDESASTKHMLTHTDEKQEDETKTKTKTVWIHEYRTAKELIESFMKLYPTYTLEQFQQMNYLITSAMDFNVDTITSYSIAMDIISNHQNDALDKFIMDIIMCSLVDCNMLRHGSNRIASAAIHIAFNPSTPRAYDVVIDFSAALKLSTIVCP